jgi:hypothetical protein
MINYKKDYKKIYLPNNAPEKITIPRIRYVALCGEGDPNRDEFSKEIEALYSFSYALKMSYKTDKIPMGYYEYVVFPLEGVWDLIDKSISSNNKENYKYTLMIRQPDFLTDELFETFKNEIEAKKNNFMIKKLHLLDIDEGECIQMMHLGPYSTEKESFTKMEEWALKNNLIRKELTHREIYISDPRKIKDEQKMKTVLRFKVGNND